MAFAIGIDLGTVYSCVAVKRNKNVEILANEQGNRLIPSIVGFSNKKLVIGDAAKNQMSLNAKNTIYGRKIYLT